ncbi:hypothetical protein A1O7_08776 [Cladophialophora yegresii CBS 114405]|uniref:Uncharacterized protein n=1 Tax=Cladophialophora yegresii CBS 114405 TaxID=1182544 RepID=W9VS90_9EURO|nr:uncharacterized protein A1O7_08776 [Cladophialophora yegresii CBS 114405]EXJ55845.1 hypothetical protein A1O7_08776 [Cladophialophora yegresii CBS 114405]
MEQESPKPLAEGPSSQESDTTATDELARPVEEPISVNSALSRPRDDNGVQVTGTDSKKPSREPISVDSVPGQSSDNNGTQKTGSDSSESEKLLQDSLQPDYPWVPGFWQRLPWAATMALILAILCGAACIAVLMVSDKQEVEGWSPRPSVWLAIFSALANASLRFALSEGVCIAWWRRASMPGTLGDLHRSWIAGVSLKAACWSVHRLNLVALASIILAVVAVDGPLLQRASSTKLAQISSTTSLNMTLAKELPFGYTGMDYVGDNAPKNNRAILTPWFLHQFLAYNQRSPILASPDLGCRGICIGEIEGAGLWRNCTESSETFSWPEDYGSGGNGSSSRRIFGVDWELVTKYPAFNFLDYGYTPVADGRDDVIAPDEAYIRLNMTYSPLPAIGGDGVIRHTLVHKTCTLYSATSRYSIRVQNDTDTLTTNNSSSRNGIITLEGAVTPIQGSVQNLRRSVAQTGLNMSIQRESVASDPATNSMRDLSLVVSLPVTYFAGPQCYQNINCPLYTTLGGLHSAAQDTLAANVTAMLGFNNGLLLSISGPLTNQMMLSTKTSGIDGLDPFDASTGWADPSAVIFSTLDEVMFRTALATAHVDALQNVTWYYKDLERGMTADAPTRNQTTQYEAYPQPQIVSMQQTRTIQVYDSNYGSLAGGLAVMFVSVIVILPLFNGFWLIGRGVSLSPLEIANAFGAPILARANSNMPAAVIVEVLGDIPARYGEVQTKTGLRRRKLQFVEGGAVGDPRSGNTYD